MTTDPNLKKISIIALFILFIAFLIFYAIQTWFVSQFDVNEGQKEFFSKLSLSNQKKVFLIGSSHVAVLNSTYIQEHVNMNKTGSIVYNLAILGDRISERFL